MKYLAWSDIINLSWLFFVFVFVLVGFFSIMMKVFAFNSSLGLKLRLSYGLGLCIIILTNKQWAFWLSSGSTLPHSHLSPVSFIYFLFFNRPSPLYCSRIIHYFLFLGIIAVNPPKVWPICALPTRGSKLITLLTWGTFR